jgi:hypothetical protein
MMLYLASLDIKTHMIDYCTEMEESLPNLAMSSQMHRTVWCINRWLNTIRIGKKVCGDARRRIDFQQINPGYHHVHYRVHILRVLLECYAFSNSFVRGFDGGTNSYSGRIPSTHTNLYPYNKQHPAAYLNSCPHPGIQS